MKDAFWQSYQEGVCTSLPRRGRKESRLEVADQNALSGSSLVAYLVTIAIEDGRYTSWGFVTVGHIELQCERAVCKLGAPYDLQMSAAE